MKAAETLALLPARNEMERAFARKDASYDGVFFVAVRTTGVFCRPSCPSRPKPDNTEFFATARACMDAGYRACKRCQPLWTQGQPPAWVQHLMDEVQRSPAGTLRASDLARLGLTPERVRRYFVQHLGMTFAEWCRGQRLAGAFDRLREGANLDDVALDSGFESHSGFRDAFRRAFGGPPGRIRTSGSRAVVRLMNTPIGLMMGGATDDGVCWLEFSDPTIMETMVAQTRARFPIPLVPGDHRWLQQLEDELAAYFAGQRRTFEVPLVVQGTSFQELVWGALRHIPCGETTSYQELARRIGRPSAQRAVANANAQNRIAILIPCHRVVGHDGTLTGYGGGLWRKRLLLELERTGRLPGH